MEMNRCAIIIQARMSSLRFPKKMMAHLSGMPLIEYVYNRCRKSSVGKVLVATSNDRSDDELYDYCKKIQIPIVKGSLDSVLKRYIQAGCWTDADYIVRVCGDTPFVDIFLIDRLLKELISEKLDYVSFDKDTIASGFYSEAVTLGALKKVLLLTNDKEDLEHVTRFIIRNRKMFLAKFMKVKLNPEFIKDIRLTIDYPEDINTANIITDELKGNFLFSSSEILDIVKKKFVNKVFCNNDKNRKPS